jgi:hypothetical protein
MTMAMAIMMFPRVSGLRERHKANDGDRKGHRLHAVTPTHLHSMFCFLSSANKDLAEREQGEAKQTKAPRLDRGASVLIAATKIFSPSKIACLLFFEERKRQILACFTNAKCSDLSVYRFVICRTESESQRAPRISLYISSSRGVAYGACLGSVAY